VEVILLEKMRNLGALGDKVRVKPGFARNFLIPQSKAVYANKDNIAKFEARRAELEKLATERHAKALERQAAINAVKGITMAVKASDEGKLFGSIGVREIVAELNKAGVVVEKREVRLSEGALRNTGEYDISIDLDSDLTATVKITVVGEG
jgi:large subunit ribosomal protein L9